MSRHVRLLDRAFPGRPALDTAFSRALLEAVAAGDVPETLRLYRPGDFVAFSRTDSVSAGFAAALAAARAVGFDAALRLAGGRAAAFHRETLGFAWTIPAVEPRAGIRARFDDVAALIAAALRRLGVDARIGAVPGEYCPGEHSVNARGARKLAGVGQRVVRDAAHVGGVIVVANAERVRAVLEPVYAALDLAWDPTTTGSVADEIGAVSLEAVEAALRIELAARFAIATGDAAGTASILARAEALEARFAI